MNWNGAYSDYLETPHWKELRAAKAKASDYRCERCGRHGRRTLERTVVGLHVHHLTYERLGNEEMDDLEVLCVPCHEEEHGLAVVDERYREQFWLRLSRRIGGRVTMPAPEFEDFDDEITAWDELAEAAGL